MQLFVAALIMVCECAWYSAGVHTGQQQQQLASQPSFSFPEPQPTQGAHTAALGRGPLPSAPPIGPNESVLYALQPDGTMQPVVVSNGHTGASNQDQGRRVSQGQKKVCARKHRYRINAR